MTTEERLDHLERELARAKRRSRWLLAVAGFMVGALALVWTVAVAANKAPARGAQTWTTIRANAFVLVDPSGKPRAF